MDLRAGRDGQALVTRAGHTLVNSFSTMGLFAAYKFGPDGLENGIALCGYHRQNSLHKLTGCHLYIPAKSLKFKTSDCLQILVQADSEVAALRLSTI